MADSKLTALSAVTSVTTDDILYVVDDPGGTPASKKVTFDNLQKSITAIGVLTTDIETASDKYLYFGADDSDGSWRIGIVGGNFVTQKRIGGTWTTITEAS